MMINEHRWHRDHLSMFAFIILVHLQSRLRSARSYCPSQAETWFLIIYVLSDHFHAKLNKVVFNHFWGSLNRSILICIQVVKGSHCGLDSLLNAAVCFSVCCLQTLSEFVLWLSFQGERNRQFCKISVSSQSKFLKHSRWNLSVWDIPSINIKGAQDD